MLSLQGEGVNEDTADKYEDRQQAQPQVRSCRMKSCEHCRVAINDSKASVHIAACYTATVGQHSRNTGCNCISIGVANVLEDIC